MKIGDVSKLLNISITTLRYYDKLGLVKPERNSNIREYDDESIEKLNSIKMLQAIGFSLEEIKLFLDYDEKYDNEEKILNMNSDDFEAISKLLRNKLKEIEEKLIILENAQKMLVKMNKKLNTVKK